MAAASERARIYEALVQELARGHIIQDERIGNLSSAMQDIRKTNSEMLVQLGAVREDIAGIKAKMLPVRQ
jgi:hypothetical protein